MNRLGMFAGAAAAMLLGAAATAPAHAAGTVILEGSDAIGYHCSGEDEASACQYMDQTWTAIGGSSALPIAVVGTPAGSPIYSDTHAVVDFSDLSTAGALSQYSAIYFVSGGGCCLSAPTDMAGRISDVSSYVNSGGTVEIENYDGNAAWDFLTGGSGDNNSYVAGFGGSLGGPTCTDGETVTATGLANGFTQPGTLDCWTHQAYAEDHFASLGFTKSFFDADPAFAEANPGYGAFSSLLSNGNTITGGGGFAGAAPEPSSWLLMILGVGGIGVMLRRAKKAFGLRGDAYAA